MLRDLVPSARQIFFGNLLLVVCCAFYLAWWLLAFRPASPVRGFASGWLLLPAFAAGVAAASLVAGGLWASPAGGPVSGRALVWGGAALYAALLVLTRFCLHRPVTTELFLIVGWAVLAASEVNALTGGGSLGRGAALVFAVLLAAVTALSLVCYVLYYRLSPAAGYLDGILPLAGAALVMAGLDLTLLCR